MCRACRGFIYDEGSLNETIWIEPEPKQWIECQKIIHITLYDLSLCFFIYLSPLPFLFPLKFSVPHPILPALFINQLYIHFHLISHCRMKQKTLSKSEMMGHIQKRQLLTKNWNSERRHIWRGGFSTKATRVSQDSLEALIYWRRLIRGRYDC